MEPLQKHCKVADLSHLNDVPTGLAVGVTIHFQDVVTISFTVFSIVLTQLETVSTNIFKKRLYCF